MANVALYAPEKCKGSVVKLIANSDRAYSEAMTEFRERYEKYRYLRITISTHRDRSADQNALWASMYQRISETLSDGSAADIALVKAECKLLLGVPILLRDEHQFKLGWNRYFSDKSYKEQLFLMGTNPLFGIDGFPVTRLLDTKQGAEYTNEIDRVYASQSVFFGDLLDGKK